MEENVEGAIPEETREYLAKIRKTIAESRNALESARLRMLETDRLLESQGLTREQALAAEVPKEHLAAVDEELRRRGLAPLGSEIGEDFDSATKALREEALAPPAGADEGTVEARRRGFGNLMHRYRI